MLKTIVRAGVVLSVSAGALVVGATLTPASACDATGEGCSDGPTSGGGTVSITVTGTFVGQGSSGSSGTTTVSAPVPCWYEPGFTGKEYAEWVDSGQASSTWHHTGGEGPFEPHPGYKQYANDDKGHWYGSICSSETFENLDEFFDYADEWFETHESVYVPAGGSPPIPPIPPEVLLRAATEALTIPEPEFQWNPDLRETGGTVVNIPTWFWLAGDIPTEGSVTATAGPWSATIELGLTNVEYDGGAAGSVVCDDGGTEWTPGAAESDCSLAFPRPNEAQTVTANARWDGTWSYNGEPQGAIDPLTADWDVTFPVAEVGSTVTEVD